MGSPKQPEFVKLVMGMLTKNKKLFESAEEFFIKEFGNIDYRSPSLLFNYTEYYKKEMGSPLKRRFISFERLIPPEKISDIKLLTNSIEEKFSVQKKKTLNRQINVDPGYISASKLILATTKDYYHRVYINKGIYLEVTLRWKNGTFEPLEWTYPDYRSKEYIGILNSIRNAYMRAQLAKS